MVAITTKLPIELEGPEDGSGNAKALAEILQEAWQFIEDDLAKVTEVWHGSTMPADAVEVHFEDLPIKPPISGDLKRYFVQNYNEILNKVGTRGGVELLKDWYQFDAVEVIELRYDETINWNYPWWGVRIWITSPVTITDAIKTELNEFVKLMLPARCLTHYQLIEKTPRLGFGKSKFGESFGK